MPKFNDLYNDKRFIHVSSETKTDIISTIGIDVNEAKDDVAESRFTQKELTEALHYLLATQAQQNPNVERLVMRESASSSSSSSSYSVGNPFYFGSNDPLLWYWSGYNSGYSQGHHHGGGSSSSMSLDGCKDEGVLIAIALACVCAAGCCCGLCMNSTIEGPESHSVKRAKVTASSVTGVAVFVVLLWYLIKNDIWRSSLVDDHDWDLGGYRFFLTLVSAFGGLLASGAVSTVNNIWRCLPAPDREVPQPSAAVLAALDDLQTVKTLLSKGWSRPGDNAAECDAFIREVVMAYIDAIACAPAPVVRVDIPPSPSSSRSTTFGRALPAPSAPLMPANDAYVALRDNEDESTAKSVASQSAPPAYK
jgi:hypothetical protein